MGEKAISTHYATISWQVLTKILLDVSRALEYMHSLKPPIYHNDIKVANILVIDLYAQDPDISVKLADVGCARLAYARSFESVDFMHEEEQLIGLLVDLYDAAGKGANSPCPQVLQLLLNDAKDDKISEPYFSNVVKRLEFVLSHRNELQHDVYHSKMEQLHILEQLEGAMLSSQHELILEILSSSELHSLGKRGQRITHKILSDAISNEDVSFFRELLETGSWGANTFLDNSHSYLIHTIARLGSVELLQVLIDKMVDI